MIEFRKKQKRLFNIMRAVVIFGAIYIVAFIGAEPYIREWNTVADMICRYVADVTVIAVLVLVFSYYSKYGKSDSFLNYIEHEISDAGYYITSRTERTCDEYKNAVYDDLKLCGFAVETQVQAGDFDFDFTAMKKREFIYCAVIDGLDRNDVIAHTDAVLDDLTVRRLKRRGDAVVCFISDSPQESAIALSKTVTTYGKKEQLKIATAIVCPRESRVYFLGNMATKCQQLIVNHVMNCELPLKDKYICKDRLPFQDELAKHMESFNITDFKNGNFFAH